MGQSGASPHPIWIRKAVKNINLWGSWNILKSGPRRGALIGALQRILRFHKPNLRTLLHVVISLSLSFFFFPFSFWLMRKLRLREVT